MEAKDLILLILMPLILVTVVFYINKNSSITGDAALPPLPMSPALPQEQYKSIGIYSIKPSFTAKIDYDIDGEYQTIRDKFKGVVDICKNQENLE